MVQVLCPNSEQVVGGYIEASLILTRWDVGEGDSDEVEKGLKDSEVVALRQWQPETC